MQILVFVVLAAILLAFANGANDNSKGVATLIAGRVMALKPAILFAAFATLLGSVTAVLFAQRLVKTFSGKGIVDVEIAGTAMFVLSVGVAAAITVLIATRLAMPVSTTHSLVGAITGTGLAANALHTAAAVKAFAIPLLVSPVFALVLAAVSYLVFRATRLRLGITSQTCVCVENEMVPVSLGVDGTVTALESRLTLRAEDVGQCQTRYEGNVVGFSAQRTLDRAHILSAGATSFARGLNDTPKIAALLIATSAMGMSWSMVAVGVAIAVGGLVAVWRVADTMSYRITDMNDGQAFTANLATAFCVIVASRLGVPVSTTHVSYGSIFGIGMVNGQAKWSVIQKILLAWITTIPAAGLMGWMMWTMLS